MRADYTARNVVYRLGQKKATGAFERELLTNSIQFVDKNDTRRFFFGQSERVADQFGAVADEHLNELGTGQF
uniref:Uncharacterized protein n=1 Tax=Romanomermis culicivorax TaxID=13658 RepID=A0A915HPS0_ROMCU